MHADLLSAHGLLRLLQDVLRVLGRPAQLRPWSSASVLRYRASIKAFLLGFFYGLLLLELEGLNSIFGLLDLALGVDFVALVFPLEE